MGEARIKQDFGDNWHLVAGILNQNVERNINTAVNNLTSNAGAYTTSFARRFRAALRDHQRCRLPDGNFDTCGIGHDLTIGSAGYRASSYSPIIRRNARRNLLLGTATHRCPRDLP